MFFNLLSRHREWRRSFALHAILGGLIAFGARPVLADPAGEFLCIVPLGDSITQADSQHNSYRRPLWFLLQNNGYTNVDFVGSLDSNSGGPTPTPDFDLDHEGHWGWRADAILNQLPNWLTSYTPDIALIHLGTNDMNQGQSVASTIAELEDIITTLRADNPDVIVFLALLIPRTDPLKNADIDALNAAIPTIALTMSTAQSPIIIVDQNTGFDAAAETYDGVHPNEAGEQKMAQKWYDAIDEVIGCATLTDPTPPTAPQINSATALSISQVDLVWDPAVDTDTGICRYFIYRDGNLLSAVQGDVTTFSDVTVSESTQYSYEVSAINQGDVEGPRGTPVQVTTPAEIVPPTIVSVNGVSTLDAVNIIFSEPVEETSAETIANYAINLGVSVTGATLSPDNVTVTLSTSTLTQGITYTLTVNNVIDRSVTGNPIATDTQVPFSLPFRVIDGLLVFYDFEEGQGTTIHDTGPGVGPLDLTLDNPNAATWIDGGLSIDSATIIQSAGPATKIIEACKASHAITIEIWIKPANTSQSGPARIFTLSPSGSQRNFTVGQSSSLFDFRLRTTATNNNGTPSVASPSGSATTNMTHVMYTRDAGGDVRIYIDGVERTAGNVGGDLSNWDTSHQLALANEQTQNRAWRGELHLAAVYDRALAFTEVQQNFSAGANPAAVFSPMDFDTDGDVDEDDLLALQNCLSAASLPFIAGCASKDLDTDGDVDLSDFGRFQICISGTNLPADPTCGSE